MNEKIDKWLKNKMNDSESFLHFECDCGSNFPVDENRTNDDELLCPACGKKHQVNKM